MRLGGSCPSSSQRSDACERLTDPPEARSAGHRDAGAGVLQRAAQRLIDVRLAAAEQEHATSGGVGQRQLAEIELFERGSGFGAQ